MARLYVLEKRKISLPYQDSNPKLSSPWHSHYTNYIILPPSYLSREHALSRRRLSNKDQIYPTAPTHSAPFSFLMMPQPAPILSSIKLKMFIQRKQSTVKL
jgi:hypothetical protein